MNEEKLIQFVQWLPTKIKELEGAKPEQIVEIINQMGQSKEGLAQLDGLLQQFEKELKTISMKNGGKFEYIKMLKNGGCPSCDRQKIEKAQDGTEFSNKLAKQIAKDTKGYSGSDYRRARRNAKSALRENSDLRGNALRQAARKMAFGYIEPEIILDDNIEVEDIPINIPEEKLIISDTKINPVAIMDYFVEEPKPKLSFSQAFNVARKRGDKIFEWNGKEYNTNLKNESKSEQTLNPFEEVKQNYKFLWNGPSDIETRSNKSFTPVLRVNPFNELQDNYKISMQWNPESSENPKIPTAQKGTDTKDWFSAENWFPSMILNEIPNVNFIQRRDLGPNSYVHEMAATRKGLEDPTLARIIDTNPETNKSDTTYVRLFLDPFTEPVYTTLQGKSKKTADNKIDSLIRKAGIRR